MNEVTSDGTPAEGAKGARKMTPEEKAAEELERQLRGGQ